MTRLDARSIKGYEIRELIGSGGFGEVYRAYQPVVKREVALKIILPDYANQPEFIRRFEREAQMVARLEHPYIVPLYDYWREPDGAYLVMRWLRGGSLRQVIESKQLWDLPAISRMVDQICEALSIAHRSGVIHRDLKPDNILLDEDRNAYLADFGIAKNLQNDQADAEEISQADGVVGTLSYITPEQLNSAPVSPQTDLYTLAVVIYEMLTGSKPFGDTLSLSELLDKHLYAPIPPLKEVMPHLAYIDELNAFIAHATQKDPAARYADALTMATAFRAIVKHVPESAAHEISALQISNPYKGLRAFQEADAADFFGRDALTKQLLARLGEADRAGRFLAVVGPSGSGKSSAIQAGLLPALRQGALPGSQNWFVVEMVPGSQPLEELAAALLRITGSPLPELHQVLTSNTQGLTEAVRRSLPGPENQLLLIIDQFEELFTVFGNEVQRVHLLDSLVNAIQAPDSQLRVILSLRADFYDRPLMYANFGDLVRRGSEVVLPLSAAELEHAIVGPAQRVGLRLETGLVETILQDLGQQPGTLPLLEYALTELFERRHGDQLLMADYRNSGGVLSALARRADELYASFDAPRQEACRQLFLRLVAIGDGTEDTRRRILHSETANLSGVMNSVIETFSNYRLLTLDRDATTRSPTIEIAHEALIRSWQRLSGWLEASRTDLQTERRLAAAAADWDRTGRDTSYLAAGGRLEELETWRQLTTLSLTQMETDFLNASIAERAARSRADEERKAKELKIARRAQTFGRVAVGLAAVGFLAIAATIMALLKASDANTQVTIAAETLTPIPVTLTNVAQQIEDGNQHLEALRLASQSIIILQNETGNDEVAALLAIRALKYSYLPQADGPLITALAGLYTEKIYKGNTDRILGLDVSPDGHWMITGSRDNSLRLWDMQTGKEVRQFTGHTSSVNSVVFSPDSRLVASGSSDKTIRVWKLPNGEEQLQLTGHTDLINAVAFSPDGKFLASGSNDKTVRLWDLQTGKEVFQFVSPGVVLGVALSPDGRTMLMGTDRLAILWDINNGKALRRLMGLGGEVDGVAFSPDGKLALTGARDSTVRLWDVESGTQIRQYIGHTDYVRSVAFSPDGKLILTASRDRTAGLWDVQTGKLLRQFTGHSDAIQRGVFMPDGKSILTGSWDGTVRQWNARLNAQPRQFVGHTDSTVAVAISPDQRTVVTGSVDKSARLWDFQTGQEIRQFNGHTNAVWYVSFSPDGRYILTGSRDKTARMWDVQTGQMLREFDGHQGVVYSANFSPDGKYVLTGSGDKTARLWDANTGQMIREFTGHSALIWSALFFPDGKHILTTSFDTTVRIWETDTGKEIRQFTGHTDSVLGAAISPDGRYVLSGGGDRVGRLWEADTGKEVRQFVGHSDALVNVAFSPDQRYIVTASQDKTARLWDLQTGQQIRQFGDTGIVNSVAFSPDGRYVITARFNMLVNRWDVDYRDLITYACSRIFQDFTAQTRLDFAIKDSDPTCPQFATAPAKENVGVGIMTSTPFPTHPIPIWTAIASPTPSLVPLPSGTPEQP